MEEKKRNMLPATLIALLCIIFIGSVYMVVGAGHAESAVDPPTFYQPACFSIDITDVYQVVGDADYVFAADVLRKEDTVYRHMVDVETDEGTQQMGRPYTRYAVKVTQNIKGSLRTDEEIALYKSGGVEQDHSAIVLFEGDELPEAGKSYLFVAYAQPDGTLLLVGPHSQAQLAGSFADKMSLNARETAQHVIDVYIDACAHEKSVDRNRYVSADDTVA